MSTTAQRILGFAADHPGVFGRLRTARILTGDINEEDLDRAPDLAPGGVFPGESAASVLHAIDVLIHKGALAKTYGDRPRLVLTRYGWVTLASLVFAETPERP